MKIFDDGKLNVLKNTIILIYIKTTELRITKVIFKLFLT